MIISCSSCSARYVVQAMDIGEDGRTVKCAKCNYSWTIPGNSEMAYRAIGENTGTHPSYASPEPRLAKNSEDTISRVSAQDHQKQAGRENLASHTGKSGPVNIKKATPNDGSSSSKSANLTIQSKPTIRDKNSTRWASMIVCLVLFLLVTGTIGGAVKYREWVTTTWPFTAEAYSILGLTTLVPKAKLRIRNVNYKYLTSDTLKVHGELVSVSKIPHKTPTLKVVFLDGNGIAILNRKLTLSKKVVRENETLKFSTEINNPPAKAKRIEVDVAK